MEMLGVRARRGLVSFLGEGLGLEELPQALQAEPTEASELERQLGAVGMRLEWSLVPGNEVADVVEPHLPLVLLVDGALMGLRSSGESLELLRGAELRRLGPVGLARWVPQDEHVAVARVMPLLPAAPLQGGERGAVGRLRGLLGTERQEIALLVVYAVAVGGLALATPLAIQVLINWLSFGALMQPVLVLGIGLLVCLALAAALRTAQRVAVEALQRRLFVRLAEDLGARLVRVRLEAFDRIRVPELVNRFFDVLTLQKASAALLLDGLSAALQAAVGLLILALYHPVLLAFDLVLLGGVAVVLLGLGRGGERSAVAESSAKYKVAGWLEELARSPVAFKLGGMGLAQARTAELLDGYLGARQTHFRVFLRQYVGMQGLGVAISAGLLVTCGWLVLQGRLTLGQLVAAEFIVASSLAGLTKVVDKLETWYDLLAGTEKLGSLVDLPVDARTGSLSGGRGPVQLHVEGLGFAFPDQPPLLDGVELELPAGSWTAVLGSSGSGKSVLADLVLGLREPTQGHLRRDGVPLEGLHPQVLHGEAALVRPGLLLDASLRDNLALARPELDDEALWRQLADLGLVEVVQGLGEGLDVQLHPEGGPLDRTEALLVLLGRALVGSPRLLVLDGALDELNADQRARVVHLLARQDCTVLVLTSRPRVADSFSRSFEIHHGGLHARVASSSA